ncbi:MAG TPA: hypothetical protein VIK89_14470 [Cytophagaceae bacterium]
MSNSYLLKKLEALEDKVKRLVKEHDSVLAQNKELEEENQNLRLLVLQQEEEIKNFQNQYKISKIVTSITEGAQDTAEMRLKINEYIKEIDKCIANLSE